MKEIKAILLGPGEHIEDHQIEESELILTTDGRVLKNRFGPQGKIGAAKNADTIHALRHAAAEIRSLRQQIIAVKAEAYDVHSEVINRLFGGSVSMAIYSAHQAEKLAEEMEREQPPIDNAHVAPGCE